MASGPSTLLLTHHHGSRWRTTHWGGLQKEVNASWGQLSRTEGLPFISLWPFADLSHLVFRFSKKKMKCLKLQSSVQGWTLISVGSLLPHRPFGWPELLAGTWSGLSPTPLLPPLWRPLSSPNVPTWVFCAPATSCGDSYGAVLLSLLSVMFSHLTWSFPKTQGVLPLREATSLACRFGSLTRSGPL